MRTEHARRTTAGGIVVAGLAALALTGCGGGGPTPAEAPHRAPSEALLGPLEEAWSVPGYAHLNDAGTKMVVSGEDGSQLYTLGPQQGEPEWEGTCGVAMFVGESIVCGTTVVNPEDGSTKDFPTPGSAVYASGGVLVVVTWEGNLVAYDEALKELWTVEGKDFAYAVEPGHLAVMDIGGSFSDVEVVDATTGEVVGERVVPLADGTVRISEDKVATGVETAGTELWEVQMSASTPVPLAMAGVTSTLEEARACLEDAELVGELRPGEQSFCLATPDGPLFALQNADASTVNVDGQEFANGWLPRAFVDSEHLLIQSQPANGGGMALWERGATEPVWEIPGAVGLDYNADGTLMVAILGDSSVVYAPAG